MDNPFNLQNRRILVTGASSGIGRECCIRIASQGGVVVATGRNEERLQATLGALSGQGHTSITGELWELVSSGKLKTLLPELDGVVHSAGVTKIVPVKLLNEATVREIMRINYEAPVMLTQQLLKNRQLRAGASIVFIASIAARIANKGNSVYAGSKGALCSFARVLALEVSAQKIRVNTLCPGLVKTPFTGPDGPISENMLVEYEKLYPLGFGEVSDVANAAVYYLSPASRWLTGTELVLDGGLTVA